MVIVMVVTVSMALPMALPTALMAVWAMQGTAQPNLGGTMTAVIECEERPIKALAVVPVRVGFSLPEKRESGSELEMATKGDEGDGFGEDGEGFGEDGDGVGDH
ncbi:unnamed protein product, partial [Ectocarpus sp. 6 AP-2014]